MVRVIGFVESTIGCAPAKFRGAGVADGFYSGCIYRTIG